MAILSYMIWKKSFLSRLRGKNQNQKLKKNEIETITVGTWEQVYAGSVHIQSRIQVCHKTDLAIVCSSLVDVVAPIRACRAHRFTKHGV